MRLERIRRTFVRGTPVLLSVVVLGGCATAAGLLGLGKESRDVQQTTRCRSNEAEPLARWTSISGTLRGRSGGVGTSSIVTEQRINLLAPVAVAAQGDYVFIADAGRRAIYRFDQASQTVRLFAEVPEINNDTRLFVDRALSVYLTDTVGGGIVQFDIDGRRVRSFEQPSELSRPSALAVDDARAEIFAADGLGARILVFNRDGGVLRAIGAGVDGDVRFQTITGMALAADQLFVADGEAHEVHALSADGAYRYSFGRDRLTSPGAVAVDERNRVFVVDRADNTIKVFRGGRFEAVVGAAGDPGGIAFRQLSDLSANGGFLFAADAGSASIEVLRVLPLCP